MMVIIDEPAQEHYGGLVAGPVFKRVGEEVLRYLGATANPAIAAPAPDPTTAAEGSAGVTEVVPELLPEPPAVPAGGAEPDEADDAPRADEPSDDVLEAEVPASAPTAAAAAGEPEPEPATDDAAEGGTESAVPDFTGMSMGQALAAARQYGLRLEVRGSGRGRTQSRRPGPAPRGAYVKVTFGPD
jgi:hypothetical protein